MSKEIDLIIDNLFEELAIDLERVQKGKDTPAEYMRNTVETGEQVKKVLSDYLDKRLFDREIAVFKQIKWVLEDELNFNSDDSQQDNALEYLNNSLKELEGIKE
jgi:hypothetical protein